MNERSFRDDSPACIRPRKPVVSTSWAFRLLLLAMLPLPACTNTLRHVPLLSSLAPSEEESESTTVSKPPPDDGKPLPPDHLRVNNETFKAADLWKGLEDELRRQAETLSPQQYRAYLQRRATQLVGDRITESLLYQRASLHLPPAARKKVDEYVDAEIRKIITLEHEGVERRYVRWLEAHGLTLEEKRDEIRRRIIITAYLEQELKPKLVEPTRAQLWAAYEAQRDAMRKPPRRRMSLIDIRLDAPNDPAGTDGNPTPSARAEARRRAEQVLQALRRGESFAEVARRFSDGLNAGNGGDWGWVTREDVREQYLPAVDALYALKEGEISDPIETPRHIFIVRCDEIDPGFEPDFLSVQPRLKQQWQQAQYQRLVQKTVEELHAQARIRPADLSVFIRAVVEAAPVRSRSLP
ncbi:MAG: hypothetical protein D6788_11635 [Planctomycetota bacterium]|nr:MAG: hypothetical protein D6788_11635 [Planctomycetota bacterium]